MPLKVITIPYSSDNYAFLILIDAPEKFSVLIDAGSAPEIVAALKKQADYPCRAVLITHFDSDHVNGLHEIIKYAKFPNVYGHKNKRLSIQNYTPVSAHADFDILTLPVHVYECYSHSNDHLAFHVQDAVFCGDILFSAGCGRFFSGNGANLLSFIKIMETLPNSTKLYFGHEYTEANLKFAFDLEPENPHIKQYIDRIKNQTSGVCTVPTTLALEKQVNPFLRYNEPAILNHPQIKAHAGNSPQVIEALRQIRNRY